MLIVSCTISVTYGQRHVKVRGYYRNGTYVRPYYRTAPNSTNRDNFSTRGNVNPYTGKRGWIRPDNNASSGRRSHTNGTRPNPTARRQVPGTSPPTHRDERRKVGRYPDGYIYATTQSSGHLWKTSHQINRIRSISRHSFVKVLEYEDNLWKVEWDGTIGYAHASTVEMNDDMLPLKTQATSRRRSVARPTYTTSTTPTVSPSPPVAYAPLSSAQPGTCTTNDRTRLIDARYVVEGAYLMNRPQGQPMLKLNVGDKVNILCPQGRWYEVAYQGMTGWVEGRLVRE